MRRKSLFLVVFLLVLYIVPMVSISSYGPSTIPAQPNTNKDYSISASTATEDSSDSIYSISETLEDNEMFSPDGFYDPTPVLASGGGGTATNNDWEDTLVLDGFRWSTFDDHVEYIYFNGDYAIEGFEYSIYGLVIGGAGKYANLTIKDRSLDPYGDDYINLIEVDGADPEQWYNGTVFFGIQGVYEDNRFYLWADEITVGGALSIDYMEFRHYYLPQIRYSYDIGAGIQKHYGTSFTNISAWQEWVAPDSWSADGDCISLEAVDSNYDRVYTNAINLVTGYNDYYLEVRYYCNATGGDLRVYMYESDDHTGDFDSHSLPAGVGWQTYKHILDDPDTTNVESVGLNFRFANKLYKVDYLRIGPADEMGYQHDGSTIEGVSESGAGSFFTDGDNIDFTSGSIGDTLIFTTDATTTRASVGVDYYPFYEFKISNVNDTNNDGGLWKLRVYGDDGNGYPIGYSNDSGVFRGNVEALGYGDIFRFTFYFQDANEGMKIDYVKLYSIANFSYDDGGGESLNDYSYIENGIFVIQTDTYTKWNYDPTLTTTIADFPYWNATIEGDDSGFRFRELQDSNALWDQGVVTGELVGTTFEDFDILIYSNCTISSIFFWSYVPEWQVISDVDIVFFVSGWHIVNSIVIVFVTELSAYSLNLIFLFLGLAMIPLSTIFLVKGGRSEMSMDKVFFGIVIFILGWALFLGGIFV